MLLPTLNKARDKAHATQCLNNQKQIGSYCNAYSNDYDDYMPLSAWADGSWGANTYKTIGIARIAAYALGITVSNSADTYADYEDYPEIFFCPSADRKGLSSGTNNDTNYGYAARLGDSRYLSYPKWCPRKRSKAKYASQFAILYDTYSSMGPDYSNIVTTANATTWSRHNSRNNHLFVDGHVAPVNQFEMVDNSLKAKLTYIFADSSSGSEVLIWD